MKMFSNIDSSYARRDFRDSARHNQVARGPAPMFLLVVQAVTIATIIGAPLIWNLLERLK